MQRCCASFHYSLRLANTKLKQTCVAKCGVHETPTTALSRSTVVVARGQRSFFDGSSGTTPPDKELQSVGQQSVAHEAGDSERTEVMAGQKRRARPLTFTEDVVLYRAGVDIQLVASQARKQCHIGAALSATGFATLLLSLAPTMPLPLLAALCGGASVNCYALTVIAGRLIQKLGAKHVDQVTILPTPPPDPKKDTPKEPDERDRFASILYSSATVEDRLIATPELRLQIRTGGTVRWLSIVDLPDDFHQASAFSAGLAEGATEGERADTPASFGDICRRLKFFEADLEDSMCADQPLLHALISSDKIVVDERAERLDSCCAALAVAPGDPVLMFSEFTVGDVEEVAAAVSKSKIKPVSYIHKLGRYAMFGGGSVLLGGCVFFVGEGARDEYGVARWINLNKLQIPLQFPSWLDGSI